MKLETLEPPVYERLARQVEDSIAQGSFLAGDRLPSVRQICSRERVSPGTVLQAFGLLESKGLVEARPRSGYFVSAATPAAAPLPENPVVEATPTEVGVSDAVARVFKDASRQDVVPFGAALPAEALFPTEQLSRCVAAAARNDPGMLGRYGIGAGDAHLRHQISKRFADVGCRVAEAEVLITIGAMEAINLAVRAVARPGDIVAVESPTFFGHLEILESLGIRALPVGSSCEHGLDLEALGQALEDYPVKAVLQVPSFANPNGSCMSPQRRAKLVSLLDDYGVPLIEDDVYGDLPFGSQRPKPVLAWDKGGQVISCGSFSKSLGPGFRVGWIVPGRYSERVRRLKYVNTVATPHVLQAGLADFLERGYYERHLRRVRQAFQTQMSRMAEGIRAAFPEGTAVNQPAGAFFLWVQLPDGVEAFDLGHRALEAGISICPGPVFCPQGRFRNYIRINCGMPWSPAVERALTILGHLAKELSRQPRTGKGKGGSRAVG